METDIEDEFSIVVFKNGDRVHLKDGLVYRDGDLPAIEAVNGVRKWLVDGKLHRDGDRPAVEGSPAIDAEREWWAHGKRHRARGRPAVLWPTEHWRNRVHYYEHGKNRTAQMHLAMARQRNFQSHNLARIPPHAVRLLAALFLSAPLPRPLLVPLGKYLVRFSCYYAE